MYKIDKKVFVSGVSALVGVGVACSIASFKGYNSSFNNEKEEAHDFSINMASTNGRNYNHTALFFDGNTAILIPCNRFVGKDNGFIEIIFDDYSGIIFSSSDISIFTSNKNISSYEQALNFAMSLTNEVYNYDDVINGEYNNIALGYKIQNEMGITKKKDL